MSRHFALIAVTVYPFERRFRLAYPRILVAQSAEKRDPDSVALAAETLERALSIDKTMADLMIPLMSYRLALRDQSGFQRITAQFEKIAHSVPTAVRDEVEAAAKSFPRRGNADSLGAVP